MFLTRVPIENVFTVRVTSVDEGILVYVEHGLMD
jgi:hypothetical protein